MSADEQSGRVLCQDLLDRTVVFPRISPNMLHEDICPFYRETIHFREPDPDILSVDVAVYGT